MTTLAYCAHLLWGLSLYVGLALVPAIIALSTIGLSRSTLRRFYKKEAPRATYVLGAAVACVAIVMIMLFPSYPGLGQLLKSLGFGPSNWREVQDAALFICLNGPFGFVLMLGAFYAIEKNGYTLWPDES